MTRGSLARNHSGNYTYSSLERNTADPKSDLSLSNVYNFYTSHNKTADLVTWCHEILKRMHLKIR